MLANSGVKACTGRTNVRPPARGATEFVYHARAAHLWNSMFVFEKRANRKLVPQDDTKLGIGVESSQYIGNSMF